MKYFIPFTQYVRPNGRAVEETFATESEMVYEKAKRIIDAGFNFECEVLSDEVTCHFTISHCEHGDFTNALVPNGPRVVPAIENMINAFDLDKALQNIKDYFE